MRVSGKVRILLLVLTLSSVLGLANVVFCEELILNDLAFKPVNLSALSGKPHILLFWTTWCPYCRAELKALNKMYPQMEKEGVAVFAVNVAEARYKVERFFKDSALNLRVLLDTDGLAAEKYEIRGVPTYIFINRSGGVVSTEHNLQPDYKSLLSR